MRSRVRRVGGCLAHPGAEHLALVEQLRTHVGEAYEIAARGTTAMCSLV